MGIYEPCGVMKSNDCPANWVDDGHDPYTCGDDLIIPTKEPGYDSALAFINKFKPPGMDDYEFVVETNESNCWTAMAFRTSAAATRFSSYSRWATLAVSTLAVLAAGGARL